MRNSDYDYLDFTTPIRSEPARPKTAQETDLLLEGGWLLEGEVRPRQDSNLRPSV